jgi:hypothetical protein
MHRSDFEILMARPTPRRVEFTFLTQLIRRAMITGWMIIALLLIRQAISDIKQLKILEKQGKSISASSFHISSLTKRNECIVDYGVYAENNYLTIEDEQFFGPCSIARKNTITITYLPGQSTIYRAGVVDSSRVTNQSTFWCLGIAFGMLVLASLVMYTENSYQEQYNLWTHGELTMATITEYWEMHIAQDLSVTRHVAYAFNTASGEHFRRDKTPCPSCKWKRHTMVPLLYNSKNPEQNRPVAWCQAARLTV